VTRTLVIVRAADPHREAEALRAALGLTLRGATVEVIVREPLGTALAERAAATLRSFGHVVGGALGPALARADLVEVWTDEAPPPPSEAPVPVPAAAPTLHLVREPAAPAALSDADWVVRLTATRRELADRGTPAPPIPPGPIDDDQLVQLLFAAARVVTW
jgi:hypothetical protein